MQKIKQFNTYLLTNHPTLWLSKLPFLLLCSIVLSLLLFVWGFIYIDYQQLAHSSILLSYFESFAALFHGLSVVCILILWATSFYKKNALRSLYPLKKGYFLKLSIFLFIGFFTLLLPTVTFYKGALLKTNRIISVEDAQKDVFTYLKAEPFLLNAENDYSQLSYIHQHLRKQHPSLSVNTLSYNGVKWDGESSTLSEANWKKIPNYVFQIEGYKKVIFLTKDWSNECNYYSKFIRFVQPKVDSLQLNSVRFFVATAEDRYDYFTWNEQVSPKYYTLVVPLKKKYAQESKTHFDAIVRSNDKTAVLKSLKDLLALEKKRELKSNVNPKELTDYIFEYNWNVPNYNIVGSYLTPNHDDETNESVDAWLMSKVDDDWVPPMYGDQGELFSRVAENVNIINFGLDQYQWFVFVMMALFLTVVVLLFEFVNGIGFLLAVPTGFVLLLLNVLIYGIVYTIFHRPGDYFNEDFYGAVTVLVNILVIQGITILGLLKQWRKRFMNVLMVLAYSSVGFIPTVVIIIIHMTTKTEILIDRCEYSFQTISPVDWLMHPYWAVGSFVLCWLSFYPLIKRHFANPES